MFYCTAVCCVCHYCLLDAASQDNLLYVNVLDDHDAAFDSIDEHDAPLLVNSELEHEVAVKPFSLWQFVIDESHWKKLNKIDRTIMVILCPILLLRYCTIPYVENRVYQGRATAGYFITAPLLLLALTGSM